MVALMRYECGLKFTGLVFENMDTVQKWLKENGWRDKCAEELALYYEYSINLLSYV